MLYWEAFGHVSDRVQQLYAEVLVSSVSINYAWPFRCR